MYERSFVPCYPEAGCGRRICRAAQRLECRQQGSSPKFYESWWKSHAGSNHVRNIAGDPSAKRGPQDDRPIFCVIHTRATSVGSTFGFDSPPCLRGEFGRPCSVVKFAFRSFAGLTPLSTKL